MPMVTIFHRLDAIDAVHLVPARATRYSELLATGDCNDGNAAINPAATEICDGLTTTATA
jgi:hypothetical protein